MLRSDINSSWLTSKVESPGSGGPVKFELRKTPRPPCIVIFEFEFSPRCLCSSSPAIPVQCHENPQELTHRDGLIQVLSRITTVVRISLFVDESLRRKIASHKRRHEDGIVAGFDVVLEPTHRRMLPELARDHVVDFDQLRETQTFARVPKVAISESTGHARVIARHIFQWIGSFFISIHQRDASNICMQFDPGVLCCYLSV